MKFMWSEVLLAAGGVGLVTGVGGKYYFFVPVISEASTNNGGSTTSLAWGTPGSPAFTTDGMPGIMTPGSGVIHDSLGEPTLANELMVALSFMFNLPLSTFGMEDWSGWGYANQNGGNTAQKGVTPWTYNAGAGFRPGPQFTPGPLGANAGYFFALMITAALVLRYKYNK